MDAGTDLIELRGLRLVAIVGVLAEERERAQPIELDVDLHVDVSAAGLSDALADTLDYGAVCDTVASVVASTGPQLLERLVTVITDALLDLDDRLDAVTVSARKLRPPVAHDLASSGVRITRRRAR